MNKTQIEKAINLLKENKTNELKELLMIELLKEDKNKNVKIVDIVKKYLKAVNDRPMLKTVMIKNEKQFICNGFNLIVFNEYVKELELLPQTTQDTLNYEQILFSGNQTEFKQEYKQIINDCENYLKFIKTLDDFKKDNNPLKIGNFYYDANYIKLLKQLFCNDFEDATMQVEPKTGIIQIKNKKITFLQLPLRIIDEEDKTKIDEVYTKFLSYKGANE